MGHKVFSAGQWVTFRYIGERPMQVWEGWYEGDGASTFEHISISAGDLLPAYRVKAPPPPELRSMLGRISQLGENTLILPEEQHIWPRFLHWLAWAGEVMPTSRFSWDRGLSAPTDQWRQLFLADPPRTFYSILDNLFLRSVAACQWIIERLEWQAAQEMVHPCELGEIQRKKNSGSAPKNESIEMACRPQDLPLSVDQRDFLVAALELSAFDSDSRQTATEIVEQAKGKHANRRTRNARFASLVEKKLLESTTGRHGGYWLTETGRSRAERINGC